VIDGSNGGTPLPPVDRLGQTNLQEGDTHEFIITGAALVALAVPATSMASQPETPGGFDTERASNIATFYSDDGYGNWGTGFDAAASRAGDNDTINNDWKADNGYLPVESSLVTP
jgi:hypothetical protein